MISLKTLLFIHFDMIDTDNCSSSNVFCRCLKSGCLTFFRREPQPGRSLQGVHPPTLFCSTAPTRRHQRAACSTYSTHPFRHAIRGSTFFKKDFFLFRFFIKKSLQHYEGVQRTILKTKGLLLGKMYCLDYIHYMLFIFLFMTVSSVHIIICSHK